MLGQKLFFQCPDNLTFYFQTKSVDEFCPRRKGGFRWEGSKAFDTEINQDAFEEEMLNYAKGNIAMVTIYIREPFAEEILISEMDSLSLLISDVGGLMGLFMGCSFVSAVEIVYHILKVNSKQHDIFKTTNQAWWLKIIKNHVLFKFCKGGGPYG